MSLVRIFEVGGGCMQVRMSEDILLFVRARARAGLPTRVNDIGRAFKSRNIVAELRDMERAGFVALKGSRRTRVDLTDEGRAWIQRSS
jgi:DNA-binding MarR family transcriptional regulator